MVISRVLSLERKFEKHSSLKSEYEGKINEYIEKRNASILSHKARKEAQNEVINYIFKFINNKPSLTLISQVKFELSLMLEQGIKIHL